MRRNFAFGKIVVYFLLIAVIVVFILPIVWTLLLSLKTADDILSMPPKLLFNPTVANYASVLVGTSLDKTATFAPTNTSFPYNLFNSAAIALSSTFLAISKASGEAFGDLGPAIESVNSRQNVTHIQCVADN